MRLIVQCLRAALIVAVCMLPQVTFSQQPTIEVVRVPTEPQSFMTATQPFSLLVRVSGVSDLFSVGFELGFNNASSLEYDGFEIPATSPYRGLQVFVSDAVQANTVQGSGTVSIGITPLQQSQTVNAVPRGGTIDVIQLNFTCRPDALHNSNTRFTFFKRHIVFIEGGETPVENAPQPRDLNLRVRGFIDVWPGDANNDTEVNISDFTRVSLYYQNGPANSRIRGFQRSRVTGAWASQRALAWDSIPATYADCNGNGIVDINDYMIVFTNFGRTRISRTGVHGGGVSDEVREQMRVLQEEFSTPPIISSAEEPYPLNVSSNRRVMGIAAKISWAHQAGDYRVTNITRSGLFHRSDGFMHIIDTVTHTAELTVANYYGATPILADGNFATVMVEKINPNAGPFAPVFEELNGVDADGEWINFLDFTSIDDGRQHSPALLGQVALFPNPAKESFTGELYINDQTRVTAHLYNSIGNRVRPLVEQQQVSPGRFTFSSSVAGLPNGAYFVVLQVGTEQFAYPLTIAR